MNVTLLNGGALLIDDVKYESVEDVIALLEQENKLLRARNERLELEIKALEANNRSTQIIWREYEPNDCED